MLVATSRQVSSRPLPTRVQRFFGEDEIIVSKTDLRGVITYANDVFCRVSGYTMRELLGAPHSLIRHPAMPRIVFKLVWDRIESGKEIFGYVINMAKNGDFYWVLAHVTPSFDESGKIVGFHSNRRTPTPSAIAVIEPVYAALLAEENKHESKAAGMAASLKLLTAKLAELGLSYDQLVFKLEEPSEAPAGPSRGRNDRRRTYA